tara:strand:+ start:114 stop:509 length:396 start_codon:yes stop_codon:yes gene_type:complete
MTEPSRIGLTADTMGKLEEMLAELNPATDEGGTKLIKFDIYRLVVSLAIKDRIKAPPLKESSEANFRVTELDEDRIFYSVLESDDIIPDGVSVYEYIERLAEQAITTLYDSYITTGQIPLTKYLTEKNELS